MFVYKQRLDKNFYVILGQLISLIIKKSFFYCISTRLSEYLINKIDKKQVNFLKYE